MANLQKAIYRSNAIPIEIPIKFFRDLERTILNFLGKTKKLRKVKTILYNKGTSGGITIPDIKLYYRPTVMKTVWYWHKNRQVDQWNWIKDLDINLHTYEHLFFLTRKLKLYNEKKKTSSTNVGGITGYQHLEERK